EPVGVGRVVAQDALVEEVGHGREAHGGAGVTVADLLNGISRQNSRGVHRASIDLIPLQLRHGHALSDNFEGARIPWRIRIVTERCTAPGARVVFSIAVMIRSQCLSYGVR